MISDLCEAFLGLARIGIGVSEDATIFKEVEWNKLKALAEEQGLSAIILDGIEKLSDNQRPPQVLLLEWIGEVLQEEAVFASQQKEAAKMAALFHQKHIRTYVLKGTVVAECYPKPNHRVSVDLDCYLLPDDGVFDAWSLGNDLIASKGFEVSKDFYKNSTFLLPDLTVESHQFLVPFRGNERLKKLERFFQSQFKEFNGLSVQEFLRPAEQATKVERENSRIEDTWLYRPPVMVSALFLIEHAYSHFLHEGLTWRMVLDWIMFSKKHEKEIIWSDFNAYIDEFGFRQFFDVFNAIGQEAFGNDSSRIGELETSTNNSQLNTGSKHSTLNPKLKSLMIEDIWASLDVHDTVRGIKGKLALAGNTWRARWKYRYFTDISWVTALWIQVKGFLFEKNPTLS